MKKNNIHNINDTGFKVPKDYFSNLDDSIVSNTKLKTTVSSSGFDVPRDYFESLEDRIIQKVSEEKPAKIISIFTRKNLIYISGIAAAILLLFNLSIFESNPWTALDAETVENYIIDENVLDSYEIATLMTDDALNNTHFINVDFDEENVENYLLNNLDVEDLIID